MDDPELLEMANICRAAIMAADPSEASQRALRRKKIKKQIDEILHQLAKFLLVAVALAVGCFVFFSLAFETTIRTERRDVGWLFTRYQDFTVPSTNLKTLSPIALSSFGLISGLSAILYVVLGAVTVRACNRAWRWAYLGQSVE